LRLITLKEWKARRELIKYCLDHNIPPTLELVQRYLGEKNAFENLEWIRKQVDKKLEKAEFERIKREARQQYLQEQARKIALYVNPQEPYQLQSCLQ